MERIKITRTIIYTAYVATDAYPGMTIGQITAYEMGLELVDAVELLEFVSAAESDQVNTRVDMSTQVALEVTSDR